MNNTLKRMHRKTVCWLIVYAFIGGSVCTSCGFYATGANNSEILSVSTEGALELVAAEGNSKKRTENAQ